MHCTCVIAISKEIKKMRNPRRHRSVNRKPVHWAGELSCAEGWAGRVRGQVPWSAHSHRVLDGVRGCLLQSYKIWGHNTHLTGKQRCYSPYWSYQPLQEMNQLVSIFQAPPTYKGTSTRALTGITLLIFQSFEQLFPSISSSTLKYHRLSAQW